MTWDVLFDLPMPGVVPVVLDPRGTPAGIYAQWYVREALQSDGVTEYQTTEYALKAPDSRLAGLSRGDLIQVAGVDYEITAAPKSDGHGVSVVYVEPARIAEAPDEGD
jgi:hypothetical protein